MVWLRSGVAVALAQATGWGSNLTPSLGTSISCRCSPKKTKKIIIIIIRKKTYLKDWNRVLWWCSKLRIWRCHCSLLGCFCGLGSIPGCSKKNKDSVQCLGHRNFLINISHSNNTTKYQYYSRRPHLLLQMETLTVSIPFHSRMTLLSSKSGQFVAVPLL